jgi:glycosyltransferase involved in cell wall biosynthesis
MKVLVLSTRQPFIWGGAEELATNLVQRLIAAGHEAEAMYLSFSWHPAERLIEEMAIARSIRISNADRVIALKFPAYLVPHHNKVIWLLHQFRQAYDLFDAGESHLDSSVRADALRAAIRKADETAFIGAHRLFATTTAAKRLHRYHGMEAEVLSAPLNDPELFSGGDDGGYVFAGGRVGAAKRQELLIRALAHARGVRLVVAGPPDEPSRAGQLRKVAEDLGVADRLTLDLRLLPREGVARLVNGCTASAYIPFDEDSVGYVTMEAFSAGKPVLTTTDSGGVLSIVRDGETGVVTEPTAEALGGGLLKLVQNRVLAGRMGAAGRLLLQQLNLTWPQTLARLMS